MSTFYIDLYNGNDSNDGTTWANAWKTITLGATSARIAGGDIIRISKTPDPVSIGNATWTDCPSEGFAPATVNISSSTNASPIEITTSANHNLSTGDVVLVNGHTGNYTANGNWQITYVSDTKFTLDGSVGVGTGGTSGTIRKINSKAVVLATAQNIIVVDTHGGWTASGDSTTTHTLSTDFGKTGYVTNVILDSSPQTSTLQAYRAITSTNFSSYQKLSFWIYNSAAIVTNNWYVALCSDTAGATPVDVFKIPAIPSTSRNVPLTIVKDGGGNLGSAIQSVAVYTDTVAPTASSTIRIDNIIACTTSGLCLQSLISKNGSAQGGTEGYYGIQSINGKVVVLDNDTNTVSTAGLGYSGTTETVETYIRHTFKTAMASSSSTQVSVINDLGSAALGYIEYQGGYEVGTTNQNGETFFDGLNGNGYGIYASAKTYNKLNYCNAARYSYGIYFSSSNNNTITTITNANNNTNYGIYFTNSSNNNTITTITNANNNSYGIYFNGSSNNTITTVTNASNNNSYGINFTNSSNNTVNTISNANNNSSYGIYFISSSNNKLKVTNSTGGTGFYSDAGINYFYDSTFNQSTEFASITSPANNWVWSLNHDNTLGNHWGFTYQATVNMQTSVVHNAEPVAWKIAITGSTRTTLYPVKLKVAEVPFNANDTVTVTTWVKKDNATSVGCKLVAYTNTSVGINSDVSDTKADDTDWEQLSITFTPTIKGVTEIYLESWYITGVSNTYIGTLEITYS